MKIRPEFWTIKCLKTETSQGQAPCHKNQTKERVIFKGGGIEIEMPRAWKSQGQEPCKSKSIDLKQKLNQSFLNWELRSVHCVSNEVMDEWLKA